MRFSELEDRLGCLWIERGGRFIGKQKLRLRGERAGNADALFLATGKFCRIAVSFVGKPDEIEQRLDARANGVPFETGDFQGQRHIAEGGARGQKVEMLEDHADRTAERTQASLVQIGNVDAIDDDLAARRTFQAVDKTDQRRLAGAGTPDDASNGAACDGEIDRIKCGKRFVLGAEAFRYVFEEDGICGIGRA